MIKFTAKTENDEISIISNTYWQAKVVNGNFMLDKYIGEGNDVIRLKIPSNIRTAIGSVIFSYGDRFCKEKPTVDIWYTNPNYFYLSPSIVQLSGKGSTAIATVETNREWFVDTSSRDFKMLVYDDKIMFISTSEEDFGCNSNDIQMASAYTKDMTSSGTVNVLQCGIYSDDDCVLTVQYRQTSKSEFVMDVVSISEGIFTPFTYTTPEGLSIKKSTNSSIIITATDDLRESWGITISNKCKSVSVNISRSLNEWTTDAFFTEEHGAFYGFKNGEYNNPYIYTFDISNPYENVMIDITSYEKDQSTFVPWGVNVIDNENLIDLHLQSDTDFYTFKLKDGFVNNTGDDITSNIILKNNNGRSINIQCIIPDGLGEECYSFEVSSGESNSIIIQSSAFTKTENAYCRQVGWSAVKSDNSFEIDNNSGIGDGTIYISGDANKVTDDYNGYILITQNESGIYARISIEKTDGDISDAYTLRMTTTSVVHDSSSGDTIPTYISSYSENKKVFKISDICYIDNNGMLCEEKENTCS